MADILHKRGTKSAFESLATAGNLKNGQIYILTDTKQIAIATGTSSYDLYARASEVGITVSATAPPSPYLNQLWLDIS